MELRATRPAAREAAARSRLWALSARALRYPTAAFEAAWAEGDFVREFAEAWRAALPTGPPPPDLGADGRNRAQRLEPHYLASFELGGAAGPAVPLYEGHHGGGLLRDMEEVLRLVHHFGLRYRGDFRPDHLATELEFLHALAFGEAAACESGADPTPYRAAASDLLRFHLRGLAETVAEALAGRPVPLYPALLQALRTALERAEPGSARASGDGSAPARLVLDLASLEAVGERLLAVESYELERILAEAAFDWDRVVVGTHPINCFMNNHCPYRVYVKDGIALREEQPYSLPEPNDPDCPDFNPKGCNKGCAGVHRLYDPCRLRYPLRRVGERGEGRWERVAWDEALDAIAETMLEAMRRDGVHAVKQAWGTQAFSLPLHMFLAQTWGFPDTNVEVGDQHPGTQEVMGKMWVNNSADCLFYADLIVIWGGNPAYTLQPLYHYIAEARYRGARVVVVSPDASASTLVADLWIPVRPGTDAALALAMAQVILEEDLFDRGFVVEQTDLPLLVRLDNRKYLRESDLVANGRSYAFALWDEASGGLQVAPTSTLELGGLRPALEGEWEVETLAGPVRVRTVFSLLREGLFRDYRPEQAAHVCGVAPRLIRSFAREFARAGRVQNVSSAALAKYYHNNLMERACLYLWMLCGYIGKKEANWHSFTAYLMPETRLGGLLEGIFREWGPLLEAHPKFAEWRDRGLSRPLMVRNLFHDTIQAGMLAPVAYLWFFHGGLLELHERHDSWDPHLRRPLSEYVREGLAARKKPVLPAPERPPRVLINYGGNMMRRVRANHIVARHLLPKLDLLVVIDWRWTATCQVADYVLPVACCWYETTSHYTFPANSYTHGIHPFPGKAVEPPGEARDEWWIFASLLERLQRKARERGIRSVRDHEFGTEKRIDDLYDRMTDHGRYPPGAQTRVMQEMVDHALDLEHDWSEYEKTGWNRFLRLPEHPFTVELATDIEPGEPIVGNTWHTVRKQPWPTATGRMHFYLDHDWYLELGEQFAWHKEPLRAGGDYPLQMNGGHTRWSVHSMWVDSPLLLRLQRGEPVLYMSPADAEARGIRDGDRVEVRNDIGRFEIQAMVAPGVRPGEVIVYHAWENAQFRGWRQMKQVMPSPFNPAPFAPAAGDYPNLRPTFTAGYPGMNDRDSRVEVERIG